MKKIRLYTPGPTPIPDSVRLSYSGPMIHHRTLAFESVFEKVRVGLKDLFQTTEDVLVLTATGTGAMDAAVANLFSPGEAVITVNAGKFGERWGKIAKAYGLTAHEIKLDAGKSVTAAQIEAAIQAHPEAQAVLFQASETSTGAMMPVQEIAKVCQKHQKLSVVDAITACGVFPLPMDAWGIDVMMTGSQKALMLPPGLAMIALSKKAWKKSESAKLPRFYFDLARERKMLSKNQTAWTPAISILQGLEESLRIIHEEGLEATYRRHEALALATREGAQALGLEILAKDLPSTAVTAVVVPKGVDGKKLVKQMKDRYGVTVVGGQDELEGKIVRLSHFGYCDRFDILTVLAALEFSLKDLGYTVAIGACVTRAMQVFEKADLA